MTKPKSPFERKLRKLRRDPKLFFEDAVKKRTDAASELAIRAASRLPISGFVRCERRYTAIAAVYNVEKYLDRFFESLVHQTVNFDKHIELIMVDDGSPDGSAQIIRKWQKKHPKSIRYLKKENGGQASARNLGLGHATGEWITFIDPDDFVHPRYFERVDHFLSSNDDKNVTLLCCKWLFYYEDTGRIADVHPLTYRFEGGSHAAKHSLDADVMISSAARSFFRSDLLAREGIYFDELLRPNFEDGHFAGTYLLRNCDSYDGYVADAIYYYRKREDGTSTLDTGWTNPGRFGAVVERGYLGLLEEAAATQPRVPVSLQRLVLYDIIWLFKRIVDNESSVSFLTPEQKDDFRTLLHRVFEHIDASTIFSFSLAGAWLFHKVGWLGLYKGEAPPLQIIYVEGFEPTKSVARLKYFHHGEQPVEVIRVDDVEVVPTYAKTRTHDFLGEVFVSERRLSIELGEGYSTLTIEIDGVPARIAVGLKKFARGVTRSMIEHGIEARYPRLELPGPVKKMRARAQSAAVQARFRDAWVLIDRDKQADDNAEHLYRHILRTHPEINAFFVLLRSSHDWDRLAADGFRLLEFGSEEHHLALLNARHLISSHADSFVLDVLPANSYRDMLTYRFTFLQHGVIRDDISNWLNTKPIDLFVTTSPREHESIAADGSLYRFGRHETKMVGLSRHDVLLEREQATEKVILIMPTWRQYLVSTPAKGTSIRQASDAFEGSTYAQAWREVLHSPRLRELADHHGYRVVFFPHHNMQVYAESFAAPDYIEVRTHTTDPVLQLLYRRAAVMITDYSSVFFEMGLLDKPVLYYQFDHDEMYGGSHPSRPGYFDFERDGFGPVTTELDELLAALDETLERGAVPTPEHLRRMRETLPRRDGGNRARTVAAILELDSREAKDHQRAEIANAQADAASERRMWKTAAERYRSLLETNEESADLQLKLVAALRRYGHLQAAEAQLSSVAPTSSVDTVRFKIEEAELATARSDFDRATGLWRSLSEEELVAAGFERAHSAVSAARAKRLTGDTQAAREALAALPESRSRDLEQIELVLGRREWREALALTTEAIARGDSPELRVLAARAHRGLGDVKRALSEADHARQAGTCPRADLLGIELLVQLDMTRDGRDRALSLWRGKRYRWTLRSELRLATLLAELGQYDEAAALLSTCAEDTVTASVRETWLDVWALAGRWRSIVDDDRRWLADAEPATRTRCELIIARACQEIGRAEEALAMLEAMRTSAPGSVAALEAYAEALSGAHEWVRALAAWKELLSAHPRRSPMRSRARIAFALERLGRRDEATQVLAEGARSDALDRLQSDPNDREAYRQLTEWARFQP